MKESVSKKDITQEYLKEILNYDPVTGIFTCKSKRGKKHPGQIAGCVRNRYLTITLNYKRYHASHLAWLYVHGKFPNNYIDHINNNPMDNRLENLREATLQQNQWNKGLQKNNTTGFKGVSIDKSVANGKRYRARAKTNGKEKIIGYFYTPEEAHTAYCEYINKSRGEFAKSA